MQHRLVNFVSSDVHLAKSELIMIFVVQNVHQVCIEWMNILSTNNSITTVKSNASTNKKPAKIITLLQLCNI